MCTQDVLRCNLNTQVFKSFYKYSRLRENRGIISSRLTLRRLLSYLCSYINNFFVDLWLSITLAQSTSTIDPIPSASFGVYCNIVNPSNFSVSNSRLRSRFFPESLNQRSPFYFYSCARSNSSRLVLKPFKTIENGICLESYLCPVKVLSAYLFSLILAPLFIFRLSKSSLLDPITLGVVLNACFVDIPQAIVLEHCINLSLQTLHSKTILPQVFLFPLFEFLESRLFISAVAGLHVPYICQEHGAMFPFHEQRSLYSFYSDLKLGLIQRPPKAFFCEGEYSRLRFERLFGLPAHNVGAYRVGSGFSPYSSHKPRHIVLFILSYDQRSADIDSLLRVLANHDELKFITFLVKPHPKSVFKLRPSIASSNNIIVLHDSADISSALHFYQPDLVLTAPTGMCLEFMHAGYPVFHVSNLFKDPNPFPVKLNSLRQLAFCFDQSLLEKLSQRCRERASHHLTLSPELLKKVSGRYFIAHS